MNMKQKIDALIERNLASNCFVGANAAVYRDGECLYEGCFGYADREAGTKMEPDSIFRIYSMTKPVTAVALMQLVEEGRIHLDFPLHWYFPSFANPMVCDGNGGLRPASRDITIRDLLNMTSGLPYPGCGNFSQQEVASFYGQMESLRMQGKPVDTMTYCERMGEMPLEFDPGTHWGYGTSADILGGVIQKETGMDYRDYLRTHIFEPLGMTDTDFYVPQEKQHRFTAAYEGSENGFVRDEKMHLGLNDYLTKPAFISGGAGLCSTIRDYPKFANALVNGGTTKDGVHILSERALEYIRTPQIHRNLLDEVGWDSLKGYDYGCLVRVLTDKCAAGTLATEGEFGWDGWTGTYFCVDPVEKLTIFFWIQVACAGTSNTAKLMRNVVYGCLDEIRK